MNKEFFKNKEILITGGTGSLGKTLLKIFINEYPEVKGIRIFSRDEFKQWKLKQDLQNEGLLHKIPIAFLIGDVRDATRVEMAFNGVDIVYNTAAMKQVPACEYNPNEAIKTNINGAQNIINAALKNNVSKIMHVSTDKAVYPVNLYGATKTVAEKLFQRANVYSGWCGPQFKCVRYGNVLGSRGSIIPLFKEQAKKNSVITITHPDMTRFWVTLDEVAHFIINNTFSNNGDIFVPAMKAMKVTDLAKAIAPNCEQKIIGIRQGEKIHECLVAAEENFMYDNKQFSIYVEEQTFTSRGYTYTSGNTKTMSIEELQEKIKGL